MKAAMILWLLLAAGAMGHHAPEEMVAELSAKLAKRPDDVQLLSRRATEYRALGMHAEAEKDLLRVVARKPESVVDIESLARVLWAQRRQDEALTLAKRAVSSATTGRERAAGLILQAEWELERGNLEAAMAGCQQAFQEDPDGMVDWYLLRSRIHERMGKHAERVVGLGAGYERMGSVVLRDAWVDAALDAAMFSKVAPVIDEELAKCRLKSSWLIRRGRLRSGMGSGDAAREDLNAAICELDRRIHPERPDAKLLIDRGLAWVLLGDREAAMRDLALARKHGADPWDIERLVDAIGE
jgi:tetratricopeptide (TPR) repeat protein